MKTKYFLVFLALLLSSVFENEVCAQRCLVFKYDNDGNRVKRFVDYNCFETKNREDVQEIVIDEEIEVYPNPTDGCINIKLGGLLMEDEACCELYDINGLLIIEKSLVKQETELDIGDLPTGVYLLKVFQGNDVISKIILKQ